MRIGLTYDLKDEYLAAGFSADEVAELDCAVTIDGIKAALTAQGHTVDRIGNVTSLTRSLAEGRRWDLVFNIAEGVRGLGREAQIPALLDAWNIPYTFSGPELLALTLHKGWTNAVIRAHGLPTADFRIVADQDTAEGVDLPFPLFVKPVAEGSSKGVSAKSLVCDRTQLREVCAQILTTYRQPALVETYLPGREFTVGLLGSGQKARVVGVLEVRTTAEGDRAAYTFANKQDWKKRVAYDLATDAKAQAAADLALASWRALGCLDAGRIDVRLDDQGEARFIEVNPLAGLNPESSDLPILCRKVGLEYDRLITHIVDSARLRMVSGQRAPGHA